MIKDESVLSRWSRRKLQSDQQTLEEDLGLELKQQIGPIDVPDQKLSELSDNQDELPELEQILTDADMPDISTLHEDSDFSGFMSSGVSDELRNLALKKLFQAPAFNIRDGLDEYDEDFTTFEKLGDIITCDMKHQLELEAEEKLKQAQQSVMQDEQASELADQQDESELQQETASIENLQATDKKMRDQESTQELANTQTENNIENLSQENTKC